MERLKALPFHSTPQAISCSSRFHGNPAFLFAIWPSSMRFASQNSGCMRTSRTVIVHRLGKIYDLFVDLVLYHLNGKDDFDEEIRQGLEQKLDAILNRQLYSRYKTAPNEEEREQARQEYLDRRGVPQSYRWTTPPWEL